MKKTFSALLAVALVPVALTFSGTAPATAGEAKVNICHATGNGKYVPLEVAKDGSANGHAGTSHQNGADIIPAYSWVENKTRYYFDGQNLEKAYLLEQGCKEAPTGTVAQPVPPTYTPATCLDPTAPNGRVIVPEDLGEGVASATPPVLNTQAGTWTVTYTLKADTEDVTYSWPANTTGVYSFKATSIEDDPLWVVDSKTGAGQCELSDTGAGATVMTAGVIGAGLMVAGVLLTRRRKGAL